MNGTVWATQEELVDRNSDTSSLSLKSHWSSFNGIDNDTYPQYFSRKNQMKTTYTVESLQTALRKTKKEKVSKPEVTNFLKVATMLGICTKQASEPQAGVRGRRPGLFVAKKPLI